MPIDRLRLLVSALLISSAALFAIGAAIERHAKTKEHADAGVVLLADADTDHSKSTSSGDATAPPKTEQPAHGSETKPEAQGESDRERSLEHGAEPAGGESPARVAAERNGERVFGVDTESTGLVIAAVAISLLLVAGLWLLRANLLVLLATIGFGLIAATFDVREVLHQIDESRTSLIVIAAIVAALHLATAAGALLLVRRSTNSGRTSVAAESGTGT